MLELRNVTLSRGGSRLIAPFSTTIAPGEIVTLMGPSGAGKSSLLSFIGGDLPPGFTAGGDVLLNGQMLNSLPPERRRIGRIFQDDLLFPHMTVAENLLFGLARGEHSARLTMMHRSLADAGLAGLEDRPPHTLSGGQRARVSLLRSLLADPAAILLDEPFSKLDRDLRRSIRAHTFSHIAARRIPVLLVTHDAEDAFPGGRILQLREGVIHHA